MFWQANQCSRWPACRSSSCCRCLPRVGGKSRCWRITLSLIKLPCRPFLRLPQIVCMTNNTLRKFWPHEVTGKRKYSPWHGERSQGGWARCQTVTHPTLLSSVWTKSLFSWIIILLHQLFKTKISVIAAVWQCQMSRFRQNLGHCDRFWHVFGKIFVFKNHT